MRTAAQQASLLRKETAMLEGREYKVWLDQAVCECGHSPYEHSDSRAVKTFPCEHRGCPCNAFKEKE